MSSQQISKENTMNWKDIAHYGTAGMAIAIGGMTELGLQIPGVVVTDPKTTIMLGVGVLVAGLKNGWTSEPKK
jgi:hypothetical protein